MVARAERGIHEFIDHLRKSQIVGENDRFIFEKLVIYSNNELNKTIAEFRANNVTSLNVEDQPANRATVLFPDEHPLLAKGLLQQPSYDLVCQGGTGWLRNILPKKLANLALPGRE